MGQFPNEVGLVDIYISIFPDFRKGLDTNGIFSLLHGNDILIGAKIQKKILLTNPIRRTS